MRRKTQPDKRTLINRGAVVIRPRVPFLRWVQFVFPDDQYETLEDLRIEASVYLIPGIDDLENSLRLHFHQIFEEELTAWWTDPAGWPAERTWEVFEHWFDYELGSVVVDLGAQALKREPL